MDGCASSSIVNFDSLDGEYLIEGIKECLKHSHDEQLLRSDSADDSSESNENRSNAIRRSSDESLEKIDLAIESVVDSVPKSSEQAIHLQCNRIDEESIAECGERMSAYEGHQEAKADQHHDVGVLEGFVPLIDEFITVDGEAERQHAYKDRIEEKYQQLNGDQQPSEDLQRGLLVASYQHISLINSQ